MPDPIISIIMPVYKTGKRLIPCVESVLAQTFQNWELILIDNGGTDECPEICDTFARNNPRIRVIHLSKNIGIAGARNVGIEHAQGVYIQFMDSDDFADKEMLEANMKIMNNNECDIIFRPARMVFTFNNTEKLISKYTQNALPYSLNEHMIHLDTEGCTFSIWNKFYKASIIKNNNLHFDPTIITGDDCVFNYQYLSCVQNFFYDDTPYYAWYQWSQNQSSHAIQTRESIHHWVQALYMFYKKFYNKENKNIYFSEKFYIIISYLIPRNNTSSRQLTHDLFEIANQYRSNLCCPKKFVSFKINLIAWSIYLNIPFFLHIILSLRKKK